MLINTNMTIAYKCHFCGNVEFSQTSLFRLIQKKEIYFTCSCQKSTFSILGDMSTNFKVKVPCIGCGETHLFILNSKFLYTSKVKVLYCPNTGIELCLIGTDKDVRLQMDNVQKKFDEIFASLGYKNYFKNTQVMFSLLNIINDAAKEGNLYCECGCEDIDIILHSDKIYLKCQKCSAVKVIPAGANEDLKDTYKNILITT